MNRKETKGNEINGHLDIIVSQHEEEFEGEKEQWNEVSIHGNPEGLKSLAKLLLEIAELNQENLPEKHLPNGAREHFHLRPNIELSKSSTEVIVGRLDAKGTGDFYTKYVRKEKY